MPLIKGAEALADDLAGIDDGDEAVGVVLTQEVAQLQGLTAGQHRHQHAQLVVGIGTVGLFHSSRAVHVLDDEVQNGLRVGRHDGAIENIRLRKVCTIMTANPQPILDFIIHDMNRSATVEKAYGAYTHHELSVLVTVLTRRQALQLRNFLRENDPHSFITIVNSSEIIGKGFRSFN